MQPIQQAVGAPLSPHFRGERPVLNEVEGIKARGPNRNLSNFIDLQNIRCSGTLTPALSRESAGEGDTPPSDTTDGLDTRDPYRSRGSSLSGLSIFSPTRVEPLP